MKTARVAFFRKRFCNTAVLVLISAAVVLGSAIWLASIQSTPRLVCISGHDEELDILFTVREGWGSRRISWSPIEFEVGIVSWESNVKRRVPFASTVESIVRKYPNATRTHLDLFGWPRECFAMVTFLDEESEWKTQCGLSINLGASIVRLPTKLVIWNALFNETVVFIVLWGAIELHAWVRFYLRQRKGSCINCGYALMGGRCSECGMISSATTGVAPLRRAQ